jgi:hypothetical protein
VSAMPKIIVVKSSSRIYFGFILTFSIIEIVLFSIKYMPATTIIKTICAPIKYLNAQEIAKYTFISSDNKIMKRSLEVDSIK